MNMNVGIKCIVLYSMYLRVVSANLQSTPVFLVMGKRTGEITRCVYNRPNDCEIFHQAQCPILSTAIVHGEYLYTPCVERILRCNWYKKNSCASIYNFDSNVYSLAIADGYLFAGLKSELLRCELDRPHSCVTVHTFWKLDTIQSMWVYNKFIYVGTFNRYLTKCSTGMNTPCTDLQFNSIVSFALKSGNNILTANNMEKKLSYYNSITNSSLNYAKDTVTLTGIVVDMTIFKRRIYVVVAQKDTDFEKTFIRVRDIIISEENNDKKFTKIVQHDDVKSISFLYGVHHMSNGFIHSERLCSRQPSPWSVFNYKTEHRRKVEVTVIDGKLRDSRGAAVDTRNADVGYSGRAAIFAMGPDGQLLLTYSHQSGLIHITSFFAGNPVSGAGEIIVKDGVVIKIIACSEYYLPDVELNKQVVEALFAKGYSRADEIILDECAYTCDI